MWQAPASQILGELAEGLSITEVIGYQPQLVVPDILDCLQYAVGGHRPSQTEISEPISMHQTSINPTDGPDRWRGLVVDRRRWRSSVHPPDFADIQSIYL